MDITWYGDNCVGIRERGVTVLYDPFILSGADGSNIEKDAQPELFAAETSPPADEGGTQPQMTLRPLGFDVDIVISSLRVDESELSSLNGAPKVIAAPGEFESRGVFVQSLVLVPSDSEEYSSPNCRLAHFMDFGTTTITHMGMSCASFRPRDSRLIENLVQKQTGILILPLGTGDNLDMDWALRISKQLDPKVCIPVGYCQEDLETIVPRLQTMGPVVTETQKRYRVKKDGVDEGTASILLSPSTLNRP